MSGHTSRFESSLGPSMERQGSVWSLDLTGLPIFTGLSVLARALGEQVIEQTFTDCIDVAVERGINPRENPELVHVLGVAQIKISVEHEAIASIAASPEVFQDHLRALLGTLQRKVYRDALFPAGASSPSAALVFNLTFPSDADGTACRFVLERLASRTDGQCYLRLTIETPNGRHIDLGSVPHRLVTDLGIRSYIAGSTRIAQTWRDALVREAARGRHSFVETRIPYNHAFTRLAHAGLGGIETVTINWSDAFLAHILESDPTDLDRVLKPALLALEDHAIRALLSSGDVVRIITDGVSVYLDQSQLGRVLNLSLGCHRERVVIDKYLDRMPAISAVVESNRDEPLRNVKVFLIHHITAEVLGLIAALRRLGCRDIVSLFVAYAGETPRSFLDALLDLPSGEFRCVALTHVPDEESVEGYYRLSTQYSSLEDCAALADAMKVRMGFGEAMRSVAVVEFMRLAARAEKQGQRCLIVEDGGYLAPMLNRAALEGCVVRDFVGRLDPAVDDERPLRAALEHVLIGSVEHTRAGHDLVRDTEAVSGTLAFPAFSIAMSRLKLEVESDEVAVSILNACENVLHAKGRVLSRRSCVVIGSRGSIGRSLTKALQSRLRDPRLQLHGVDLKIDASGPASPVEAATWDALSPDARRNVDLVIGVTGRAVLTGADVEQWLMETTRPELILASGSTKTIELSRIAAWLDTLMSASNPVILGRPVSIEPHDLEDPQTERLFGQRYEFRIQQSDGRTTRRSIIFLANLTPVNFLFYGVPSEVIDEVLAELARASLGLVRRVAVERIAPRLYAVDHEITADGGVIPAQQMA